MIAPRLRSTNGFSPTGGGRAQKHSTVGGARSSAGPGGCRSGRGRDSCSTRCQLMRTFQPVSHTWLLRGRKTMPTVKAVKLPPMDSKPRKRRRGHGEGSIFQAKDGRWVGMVELGYVGGKRKRKVYYGTS